MGAPSFLEDITERRLAALAELRQLAEATSDAAPLHDSSSAAQRCRALLASFEELFQRMEAGPEQAAIEIQKLQLLLSEERAARASAEARLIGLPNESEASAQANRSIIGQLQRDLASSRKALVDERIRHKAEMATKAEQLRYWRGVATGQVLRFEPQKGTLANRQPKGGKTKALAAPPSSRRRPGPR